jgi:large subunit ribosomal protein L17
MAQNLIEHGQITTTLAKAKDLQPFFERLVTLAIKARARAALDDAAGALRARRSLHRLLGDRALIPKDHKEKYAGMSDAARAKSVRMASGRRYRTGEPRGRLAFTAQAVTHRLIETLAPRFEDRPGGYTRLIRLPQRRIGDCSKLATVQLVGEEEAPTSLTKPKRSARRRRADARYAMSIKLSKSWAGSRRDVVAEDASAAKEPETPEVGAADPTPSEEADDVAREETSE